MTACPLRNVAALTATLEDQFNEGDRLTALIREKLAMVVPDAA
jgi:type I restriction enzyme M protein